MAIATASVAVARDINVPAADSARAEVAAREVVVVDVVAAVVEVVDVVAAVAGAAPVETVATRLEIQLRCNLIE